MCVLFFSFEGNWSCFCRESVSFIYSFRTRVGVIHIALEFSVNNFVGPGAYRKIQYNSQQKQWQPNIPGILQSDNFHKRRRRGSEISGRRRLSAAHTKLKFIGAPFIILAGNRWAFVEKIYFQHPACDGGLWFDIKHDLLFFRPCGVAYDKDYNPSRFSALRSTFFYCCYSFFTSAGIFPSDNTITTYT